MSQGEVSEVRVLLNARPADEESLVCGQTLPVRVEFIADPPLAYDPVRWNVVTLGSPLRFENFES